MGVGERVERRSSRSACSSRMTCVNADRTARIREVVDRRLASRIALLPVVVVRAIEDLVLRDARQPRHQRLAVRAAKLVEMLERLEERGLQDVARLEPLAKACDPFSAGCTTAASACIARTSD